MDGATLFTLLVGVAITLGVDRYREWRTDLRESKERQREELRERESRQRETAKELQMALIDLRAQTILMDDFDDLYPDGAGPAQIEKHMDAYWRAHFRVTSLASRIDSEQLRNSVEDLHGRAIEMHNAKDADEQKVTHMRWSRAATAVDDELGKMLR